MKLIPKRKRIYNLYTEAIIFSAFGSLQYTPIVSFWKVNIYTDLVDSWRLYGLIIKAYLANNFHYVLCLPGWLSIFLLRLIKIGGYGQRYCMESNANLSRSLSAISLLIINSEVSLVKAAMTASYKVRLKNIILSNDSFTARSTRVRCN